MTHLHLVTATPVETAELFKNIFGATQRKKVQLPEPNGRRVFELDIMVLPIVLSDQRRQPLGPNTPQSGLDYIRLFTDDAETAGQELKAAEAKVLEDTHYLSSTVKVGCYIVEQNIQIHICEIIRKE